MRKTHNLFACLHCCVIKVWKEWFVLLKRCVSSNCMRDWVFITAPVPEKPVILEAQILGLRTALDSQSRLWPKSVVQLEKVTSHKSLPWTRVDFLTWLSVYLSAFQNFFVSDTFMVAAIYLLSSLHSDNVYTTSLSDNTRRKNNIPWSRPVHC